MNPEIAVSIGEPWMWAAFVGFVLVMLAVDLFLVGGNKAHKVSFKEAAAWSFVWFSLAMLFNLGLWWYLKGAYGGEVADVKASNGVIHAIDTVIMPVDKDIVTVAGEAGSFNTLAKALQAAGLVETLKGKGPFTVFAPTDEAFAKLPPGTLE